MPITKNLFPDVAHESNVLNIPFVAHGTLTNNSPRQWSLLGSLSAFPGSETPRIRAAPGILDAGVARLCLESRFWRLSLATGFRRQDSPEILALQWTGTPLNQWRGVTLPAFPDLRFAGVPLSLNA